MTVPLLPPLCRSGYNPLYPAEALTEGPAYILGRPSPRFEPRWHRVRAGRIVNTVDGEKRTIWDAWCGPSHYDEHVVAVDTLPPAQPLCGTCEGRAKGHVGDDGLIFSPNVFKAPRTCPSKTLYVQTGYNVGRCLACGQLASLRCTGGPYNPREIITSHPPLKLVPPCGFHGWRSLVADGDTARCGCGAEPWTA
jgi:hypothetical protein